MTPGRQLPTRSEQKQTNAHGRSFARRGVHPGIPVRPRLRVEHTLAPVAGNRQGEPVLRFVPLGGLEEIGRNCSFFEYKNEIVIIDIGIQFPEEETPGIDYIIPNITYLEGKKENIRGLIITHGHYDHIAAIHYLIEKLGNPPIYTAGITKAIIEKRHQEFPNAPKLRFDVVKHGSVAKISEHFTAKFFNVDHTIPDAMGFIMETPSGNMLSFGDFRVKTDERGNPYETDIFKKVGDMEIHSVFIDSTSVQREGFSVSEHTVEKNLEELIKHAPGRIIIATFSSLLTRIAEIMKIAERHGRKVAINGRSMKDNVQIARDLGYLKVKNDQLIDLEDVHKHKDERVLILTTGAQGEANAGLMRIVNGEHRLITLKRSDTVVFSSSVVPGNERSVQALQDNIARQVDEVYNSKLLDIHASGHAYHDDIALVLKLVRPRFVIPIHGYYFMRTTLIKIAKEIGMDPKRVIMLDNGQVATITNTAFTPTEEKVPSFYVMVDGLGVGDVEEVVLRDRRSLAQEGMIVIILTIDRATGKLLKNPDIISRGFIYLKGNQDILEDIRKRLRGIMARLPAGREVEPDYLKTLIRDQIGQYLYNRIKRRPMILPVAIEI